jgi:two-component system LytT family sensor kinase
MPNALTDTAAARVDRFPLRGREIALVVLFWTLFGAVTAANRLLDPRGAGPASPMATTFALLALAQAALWALLTPPLFSLAGRFEPDRGRRLATGLLLVGAAVAAAVLVHYAGNWLRAELLPEGMRGRGPFRGGRGGPWRVDRLGIINELVIAGAIVAAGLARGASLHYRARKEQATRLQAQLAEARLDALRRQLDPHFLFNTLHAISSLVERDPRGVRRMIARLSELLRHSIEGSAEQEIPLRRELALLEQYLDIMRVRFQGRLEVTTTVDDAALDLLVPNLVLQPLVENAIKHGVSHVEGTGHIAIEARVTGGELVLRVRDDGPGLPDDRVVEEPAEGESLPRAQRGVGLRNTRERLAQLYGDRQRFTLGPAAGGGAVAELAIPVRRAPAGSAATSARQRGDDA